MKPLQLFLLLFSPLFVFGQGQVGKDITSLRNSGEIFETVSLMQYLTEDLGSRSVDELAKGTLMMPDLAAIQQLQRSQLGAITLQLPAEDNSTLTLELMQHEILTPGFQLFTSSSPQTAIPYTAGMYYKGIIRGMPNSVAAISVFNDEVRGVISYKGGNLVLARLRDSREGIHVLYNDADLLRRPDWECATPDDVVTYDMDQLHEFAQRDVGDCVKLYIEIDDDIVTDKGGATGATNYITGLFNESITLYANDGIEMAINEIFAWTTNSPYSGSSSSAMLNSYQANTGSFNGDLSHLVSYQASGGIAAGFSGICNPNPDNSKCFSSINSTYSQVPTYSWSVMVVTHEMGHLIGSRHTHACVWNGNNTAIDGCAGSTEGSCSLPGNPPEGGTIMSYCHLTSVGINLSLGFGPQPGDVVRGTVNASGNCLTTCGGPPPPPSYCASSGSNQNYEWIQAVALESINNTSGNNNGYADYTSLSTTLNAGSNYTLTGTPGFAGSSYTEYWSVWIDYNNDMDFDDAGEQVGSGSGSGNVNISFTVPSSTGAVTTRMRVSMQYNAPPPVCGSFTYGEVEDYTVVISTGGGPTCTDGIQNGDETGVDCGGSVCPPCPTCDDGIQNGDETGVDCGGSVCPPCPTCDDGIQNGDETGVDCGGSVCPPCPPGGGGTLFAHYFETGWDGWIDGGSDCYRYFGSRSWEGNYSIRLRDNSGTNSAMTSSVYDVSGFSSLEIEFYFYPYSMETGEDFWVRFYDGSSWHTIAAYASGTSFSNYNFYVATVTITSAQYNFPSNAQFRFQCDASTNSDHIYIDAVTVTYDGGGSLVEPGQTIRRLTGDGMDIEPAPLSLSEVPEGEVAIYPNPATDQLNIHFEDEIAGIRVISAEGVEIRELEVSEDFRRIDTSTLPSGMYIVMIQHDGEWTPVKFMKL
ncbi:MAG: M12 family metallo-peptidase [Saprospiraceae bacterium]|nr:M12 family metallo-peptidase [Saprospiraceae bacterium]